MDVAASIISYETLYNLHCPIVPKPDEEKLYPKGVVFKALQNVAFQDDGLIQYKAEVMLGHARRAGGTRSRPLPETACGDSRGWCNHAERRR